MDSELLKQYPDLDRLLKALVENFSIKPVKSIFLIGGLTLGDFSVGMSDIDVIMVSDEPIGQYVAELQKKYDLISGMIDNQVDVKFIEEKNLSDESPLSESLDATHYRLHAFDLILLKKHGWVLYGDDCRGMIKDYDEKTTIEGIIKHFVQNMLPSAVQEAKEEPCLSLVEHKIMPYTFVMVRCIYTLYNNALTSKPKASDWLSENTAKYPSLAKLSGLASIFTNWYRQGKPENIDYKDLCCRFVESAPSFASSVQRNVETDPEKANKT